MKLLRFFLKFFLFLYFAIGVILVFILFSDEEIYFNMNDIFNSILYLFAPGLIIIGGISVNKESRFISGVFYLLFFLSSILAFKVYPWNDLIEPVENYEEISLRIIYLISTIYFLFNSIIVHFSIDENKKIKRRK